MFARLHLTSATLRSAACLRPPRARSGAVPASAGWPTEASPARYLGPACGRHGLPVREWCPRHECLPRQLLWWRKRGPPQGERNP